MRNLIMLYLLIKSASKRTLIWFDIYLARVFTQRSMMVSVGNLKHLATWELRAPEWLHVIADLEVEQPAPEAFGLFLMEIGDGIDGLRAGLQLRISKWCYEASQAIQEWMR